MRCPALNVRRGRHEFPVKWAPHERSGEEARLQSRRPPLRPAHAESAPAVLGKSARRDRKTRAGSRNVRYRRCRNSRRRRRASASATEAPVKNALLDGPILRTLLSLAWPNVLALTAGTCVVIAETSYIGRLGVDCWRRWRWCFPTVILTMTMLGGAMGGGVASAIARALGAGDIYRASTLAAHAFLIGLCFGLTFMLGMLIFGPALLELLGGRGNVLTQAIAYTQIFFGGAVLPWLMNTMSGILRGTGNMSCPRS